MSTFLQVLRLTFWIHPLQRVLTCVAVFFAIAEIVVPFVFPELSPLSRMSFFIYPSSTEGLLVAAVVGLLIGGVYWRVASAPRIVRLAPHGRTRLLGSVLTLIALIAVVCTLLYWVSVLRWVGPKYQLSIAEHMNGMMGFALLTSIAAAGTFIASRSPFTALLVLIVLITPGATATLLGMDDVDLARKLRPAPTLLAVLALLWTPFAIWYLNARRISRPRWLASGGQDVLATALVSAAGPTSRREALERQLLGGSTAMQLGLMWFVVLGLLLAMLWLLLTLGNDAEAGVKTRVMYVSLTICPIVTTVVSFAAVRRSRALWLLATSSRVEFFACVDRILMRLNLAMVLVHASWLVVVWFTRARLPGSVLAQLDGAQLNWLLLWVPGFVAINAQLARLPKWPIALAAVIALYVLWPLSMAGRLGYLTTMALLLLAVIATFALRWLARHRWRDGDFPRAVCAAP